MDQPPQSSFQSNPSSQPPPTFPIFLQSHNSSINKLLVTDFGQVKLNPFTRNINKRILTSPEFLEPAEIPATHRSQFIKDFSEITGTQNLFPILLELTNTNMYVCSKDCFIGFPIQQPSKYQKVKLPQMPTSFKAYENFLYFGLRSGIIIIYNITTKTTIKTCQQFTYPVLQIEMINKDTIIAMDLYGNLKILGISKKIFMERLISVSISVSVLIEEFRVKKRDKIKNLVKNLPFRSNKKDKEKVYDRNVENVQPVSQQKQQKVQVKQVKQQQTNRFSILQEKLRVNSEVYPLVIYHKGIIKSLTLQSSSNSKVAQKIILQNIEGSLGMLELGQGGFTHSNQAHIILVVSIENTIYYFRQILVQNTLQFIQISSKTHSNKIYNGKFISNNLLVFLTQQGIEISNVNSNIQILHKINYNKFSYIDFFNEEQQFNFDKRLLYRSILKIGKKQNNDCFFCCLQGKHIISGTIYNWNNYLNAMVEEYQWDRSMKSALMIYQNGITLLGEIPQKMEERNEKMKNMFEKIALTYLSYSLKNNENPSKCSQIIHNVIDFMVRTESFTYLFTTIYEATKSSGLEEVFMQQLQEYIESGSIKWMTEDVLYKVVQHYTRIPCKQKSTTSINIQNAKQSDKSEPSQPAPQNTQIKQPQAKIQAYVKQKKQVYDPNPLPSQLNQQQKQQLLENRQHLQTMIMSFDLSKMEKSLLLSICLNNQLYRSLIHICRNQGDYVTPVIKLCGLRMVKLQQYKNIQQKTQKDNAKIINNTHRQLTKLSNLIFYYLNECLAGRMTQFDNTKQYLEMLQQLLKFIFIPSSFLMLLQASNRYTFRILGMIFGAHVMQYLLQNPGALSIKKSKYFNILNTQIKLNRNNIDQILAQQLSRCKYRYTQIPYVKNKFNPNKIQENNQKNQQYYNIFNYNYHQYANHSNKSEENGAKIEQNIQISQQFAIYNNILAVILYTIIDNYSKYHIHSNMHNYQIIDKQIISKLFKYVTKQQSYQSLQYQQQILSEQQLSQLYLFTCHKFILYLILTNSFPIRLSWKVLTYQYIITYPYALENNKQVENENEIEIENRINAIAMRIIDSVIRQGNYMMETISKSNKESDNKENITKSEQRILQYLLEQLQGIIRKQDEIFSNENIQQMSEKNQQNNVELPKIQYKELFMPTKCYLLDLLNKSNTIVKTLLGSKRKYRQSEIFSYLKYKIDKLLQNQVLEYEKIIQVGTQYRQNTSQISLNNELIQSFLSNLPQLIIISQIQTLSLLISISKNLIFTNSISLYELNTLITYLDAHPQAKLTYIQHLLSAYEKILHLEPDIQQQLQISGHITAKNVQTLAIKHLETVLQYKKEQLQEYVLRINYPLEQAFKVCQQCNNKTAMAYILIKSGRNLEGVLLISDLLKTTSGQVFKDIFKNQQTQNTQKQIQKMNSQLNKILQTCTNQYINDAHKGEEIWEKISEKLFRQLNVKAVDTIQKDKIRQILQNYMDKLITSMFSQVTPQFFIEKFSQNIKMAGFPTRLYLQAHDLVYERLNFRFEINSLAKELLRSHEIKMYKKIVEINKRGVALVLQDEVCERCGQKLDKRTEDEKQNDDVKQINNIGRILVYNCGHAYHINCYQQLRQEQKKLQKARAQSPTLPKVNKKSQFAICPNCKSEWDGLLYEKLETQPERFKSIKPRKNSVLIQRKNKLAEFDAFDYFGIMGESLLLNE